MDLSIYKIDLDTDQPNGGKGESPRSAFTKYNNSLDTINGELTTLGESVDTINGELTTLGTAATADILGTMANGAIIESGDNENGEYVKFAGGAMLARRSFETIIDITESDLGTGTFRSPTHVVTLPVSFSTSASVTVVASMGFGGGSPTTSILAYEDTANTARVSWVSTQSQTDRRATGHLIAYGRWK